MFIYPRHSSAQRHTNSKSEQYSVSLKHSEKCTLRTSIFPPPPPPPVSFFLFLLFLFIRMLDLGALSEDVKNHGGPV